MARPIILGVVGDSAAGKTTISKGLVEILGEENVTHIGTDDYHRYDRAERAELGITPLDPECNYIDIMSQDIRHLRDGEPILKPVYGHGNGTFGRPDYVKPKSFVLIEGLLGYHTTELASNFDVRVYLAPPEELRREWKVKRDTTKRGYTEEQVLAELDMREPDSESFIRPQRSRADIVVAFQPGVKDDPDHLDAVLTLREGLPHPDLSSLEGGADAIEVEQRASERRIRIPGEIDKERGAAIEEAIWEQMHFARHLRTEQLGLFAIGTDEEHRSESLAITQVLILYHLVTAKATAAIGGNDVANGRESGVPSPA